VRLAFLRSSISTRFKEPAASLAAGTAQAQVLGKSALPAVPAPQKPAVVPGVKASGSPVASGKGGVGKIHYATNLALPGCPSGARVALLDADLYGPSSAAVAGVSAVCRIALMGKNSLRPMLGHGIQDHVRSAFD